MKFITVFLLITPFLVKGDMFDIIFKVQIGEKAILNCVSNLDDVHTFMFWHLPKTQEVIGPRNQFDHLKYNYDAVTGNLEIRDVTKDDEGVYNCISEGIYKQDIKVRDVILEVRDATDDAEDTYQRNLLIIITILLCALVMMLIVILALCIRYRFKPANKEFDSESGCSRNDIYQPTTTTDKSKLEECYTNKTPEEESLVSTKTGD